MSVKNHFIAVLLCGAMLAVSCVKEEPRIPGEDPDFPAERELVISAGVEDHENDEASRTILRAPNRVHWVNTDSLKVFDAAGYGKVFGTRQSDVQRANFSCQGLWEGLEPVMAVHSFANNIDDCAFSGGKYSAYLSEIQPIFNKLSYAKKASVSIGRVVEEEGRYQIETMQNMFSLLGFTVKSPNIKTVILEGVNGEKIAGWMDINYRDGTDGYYSTCSASTDPLKPACSAISVTVSGSAAGSDNCFSPASQYYISVFPQTFTNGIILTLENNDEPPVKVKRTITRMEGGAALYLNRNRRHLLNHPLDDGVVIDDLTLNLDFTASWPFSTPVVGKDLQSKSGTSGEVYTFPYVDGGEPQTCEFEIANPSGDENYYSYSSPHLRFNGAGIGTWIKLPLMEGRMLHSVTMAIDNTAGKSFRVDSPLSASFTSGSLSYDTAYYLYFVGATNFQMTRLTLTYGKF